MPDITASRRYLRTNEAALWLGVARQTLARWRVEGVGPPFVKLGGAVLYDVHELENFVEQRRRRSTADAAFDVTVE